MIIQRYLKDPGLGIKLCWLLEADLGCAWEDFFEHRQQNNQRLIVVLLAEKVQVIAKIGAEKQTAFDLLQDTKQATAFGCCILYRWSKCWFILSLDTLYYLRSCVGGKNARDKHDVVPLVAYKQKRFVCCCYAA